MTDTEAWTQMFGELRLIRNALERLSPPPAVRLINPNPPAGEDALTVVTPALRRQWEDDDRANSL